MSANETAELLQRVRAVMPDVEVAEKRMFGGVTLMLNGNMLCCASKKGLMVRVGKEAEAAALQLPHARPCDGAGHKMPGFVMIDPAGLSRERDLAAAIRMALRYVSAMPLKDQATKATSRRPRVVTHRP
ncbi:MAG: TfoX/Sxy family protein [Pseudomonadota bacterium]